MIRLGPAGVGGEIISGLKFIKDKGLGAAEIEFTHGVRMSIEKAKEAGQLSKELGIALSVHAPYYINLASKEEEKIEASKRRIIDSCQRGHYLGAKHIVFHPGFFMGRDKEQVYQIIKDAVIDISGRINKEGYDVVLAPETTGKASQFGDLDELLRLKKDTGCGICVDFAHIYARNLGKIDFGQVFNKLKAFRHIHSHFSGIEYTDKGEKRHIIMDKGFFRPLAEEIIKRKVDITIISESPITWEDSLKMKQVLDELAKN